MVITGSRLKALLIIAIISTVVSLYQWIALLKLRSGNNASLCHMGAWLDCSAVWNSSLSLKIQSLSLLPVPAWGMLWGLAILTLIFRIAFLRRQQLPNESLVNGLGFLLIMAGAISVLLMVYGLINGRLCFTCLVFYALVFAACFTVLRGCTTPIITLLSGASSLVTPLLIIYVFLLYPAISTPFPEQETTVLTAPMTSTSVKKIDSKINHENISLQHPLALFLKSLPVEMQKTLSVALFIYRTSPFVEQPVDESRLVFGDKNAPVHFTGWVDFSHCEQCRFIEESLFKLRRAAPRGSWNYDIRQFPLSHECNPYIEVSDPSGVSCLAAKILICTKDSTLNDLLRLNFYRNSAVLNPSVLWSMAKDTGLERKTLEQCTESPATAAQLKQDIEDAKNNFIRGVPMIAVNGRKATFHPSFLYSLILAEGRDDHPAFDVMVAPSE